MKMVEPNTKTAHLEKTLPTEEIAINVYIADGQADSTHNGGPRPPAWKLPLVTKEEYELENPYRK